MISSFLAPLLILSVVVAAPDDVKTKSGKEFKNLTLKSENAKELVFADLDDKKITIPKDQIASWDKKPTIRDDLQKRREALKKDDIAALVELGKWAQSEGLARDARTIWQDAVKAEPDNASARALLGFKKVDGAWVSAADIEAADRKANDAKYKLLGFKDEKGKLVAPADQARAKLGLVQKGEFWVTKEQAKRIDAAGLVNIDGAWLTADDKAKYDSGLRHANGKWIAAADADVEHKDPKNPWIMMGPHVELRTTTKYERAKKALVAAEEGVRAAIAIAGIEPDVYGDKGLLLLVVGRKLDDYKAFGARAKPDWAAERSSSDGVFYALGAEKNRGGAFTFDNDDDWLWSWSARGAFEAWLSRFTDITRVDATLLDAFAGYFAAFHEGKFSPSWQWYSHSVDSKTPTLPAASALLPGLARRSADTLYQAGLFIAFAADRNPVLIKNYLIRFLTGQGTVADLMKQVSGSKAPADIDAEFKTWIEAYRKTYKPWDKA